MGGQLSEDSFSSLIGCKDFALSLFQLVVVILVTSLPHVFHLLIHYVCWVSFWWTAKDFPKTQQDVSNHLRQTPAHVAPNKTPPKVEGGASAIVKRGVCMFVYLQKFGCGDLVDVPHWNRRLGSIEERNLIVG